MSEEKREEIKGDIREKRGYVLYGDLKIRRFEEGGKDKEEILELLEVILRDYGFTIQEGGSEKDCKDIGASYRSGEFWVVVNNEDKIIATAAYRRFARGGTENYAELRRLYINGRYRRLGLGGMLLTAVENRAHRAGYKAMILESAGALTEALKLYLAKGYVDSALPEGACLSNRCDIVMEKQLHFDSHCVQVMHETGELFAQIPVELARRGRMRVHCVIVVMTAGKVGTGNGEAEHTHARERKENVMIRVLHGNEKAGDIAMLLAARVTLVSCGLHGGMRNEMRLCCEVYMTQYWDVAQVDRSKWLPASETDFVVRSSGALSAMITKLHGGEDQ